MDVSRWLYLMQSVYQIDFVTYAMTMTLKSSQFQGSLKKVNGTTQNPRANIFMADSKV